MKSTLRPGRRPTARLAPPLSALAVLVVFGCSPGRTDSTGDDAPADSATAVQTYEGSGLVTSVMPNREYVVVDHEDIPGFMSAMKMPFAIRDTALAAGVSAGDSISFTVEVDGPYIHITRIVIEGR